MGHDFRSLDFRPSDLVQQYHEVMQQLSNPIYAMLPSLEKYLPRGNLIRNIDSLEGSVLRDNSKKTKRTSGGHCFTTITGK